MCGLRGYAQCKGLAKRYIAVNEMDPTNELDSNVNTETDSDSDYIPPSLKSTGSSSDDIILPGTRSSNKDKTGNSMQRDEGVGCNDENGINTQTFRDSNTINKIDNYRMNSMDKLNNNKKLKCDLKEDKTKRKIKKCKKKNKKYYCNICDSTFVDNRAWNNHKRNHQVCYCSICGKKFARTDTRDAHVLRVHDQIKTFPCRGCGKLFFRSSRYYHEKFVCKEIRSKKKKKKKIKQDDNQKFI